MTDADVKAANKRLPMRMNDLINDAIFSIELDALSFDDGAVLADVIIDDIISILRRALPNINRDKWENILGDYRVQLVEQLDDRLRGMVNIETTIEAIENLGAAIKPPPKPQRRSRK